MRPSGPRRRAHRQGACPTCEQQLAERRKVPWHFKLLVLATVGYLGWRAYQGIGWLAHHI